MSSCLSDTLAEEDGTVTASCGCGWHENCLTQSDADRAARGHQEAADQREAVYA